MISPAAVGLSLSAVTIISIARYLWHAYTALKILSGPPIISPIIGNTVDLGRAVVGTRYPQWKRLYGHTYKLRDPLLTPVLVLGDPKGVSHVLSGNASNYPRAHVDRVALDLWFGKGLLSAEGATHQRMKKTLNGAFTSQSIREISGVLFDLAHRLTTQWEQTLDGCDSSVFNVSSTIHMLALDAISMTMFRHNLSATEGQIPELLNNIANAPKKDATTALLGVVVSYFPALLKLPSPMSKWAQLLRGELGKIAEEVYSDAQETKGMHSKVLDLMNSAKSGGASMSKEEAVAQIIGILFAGSETNANVLSECFYELGQNPDVQHKLRKELVTFETTHGRVRNYDDLMNGNALPYLDAVARETMRLKAVLMKIARVASEDDIIPLHYPIAGTYICHVKVKAGQEVWIPVRDGVNVDEDIWGADAKKYRPERWIEEKGLPDTVDLIRAQGHTLTFGDGPKVCLGRTFALAEFKIVVSVALREFAFEDAGLPLDFYHLGGNTVQPMIRGREEEGVQMPIKVCRI